MVMVGKRLISTNMPLMLMLSDNGPDMPYSIGENMTAALMFNNLESAKKIYDKLSVDAKAFPMELQETFWSPMYGIVVDKYGMS